MLEPHWHQYKDVRTSQARIYGCVYSQILRWSLPHWDLQQPLPAVVQAEGCAKVPSAFFPPVHLYFSTGNQCSVQGNFCSGFALGNQCHAATSLGSSPARQISSSVSFWHLISYSTLPLCLCTMIFANMNGLFLRSAIYIKLRWQALLSCTKATAFTLKKHN